MARSLLGCHRCCCSRGAAEPQSVPRFFGSEPEAIAGAEAGPVGVRRLVEVGVRPGHFVRQLPQRREVVQDPEGASLGGDHEVAVMDLEVGDGRHRQVELERLPPDSVVERDIHPVFRAGEQEALSLRILPDRANEVTRADAVVAGQEAPGGAVVVRPEYVRREVVLAVPVHGDESASGRVR